MPEEGRLLCQRALCIDHPIKPECRVFTEVFFAGVAFEDVVLDSGESLRMEQVLHHGIVALEAYASSSSLRAPNPDHRSKYAI